VLCDLPSSIQPASLSFSSRTDPDASIVEHTFEDGTHSLSALLAKSVGEMVRLKLDGSVINGRLLRIANDAVMLETDEGAVEAIHRAHMVSAEVNHGTFNKEHSLHCVVETQHEGPHKAQLTYEASGITWSADYTLVLRPGPEAEFTGWFTLENVSGKTFKNAALALVSAPYTEIAPSYPVQQKEPQKKSNTSTFLKNNRCRTIKPKVKTQDTSYLPRPITLVHGKEKQVLITRATFPIEEINLFRKFDATYRGGFQGTQNGHSSLEGGHSVNKVLRWTNSKSTHHRLGIELAAGSVDVLDSVKGDTFLNLRHQQQLQFTHPGDEILLTTGQHPHLTGKRQVSELKSDVKTQTIRETVQIDIKNSGPSKQEVIVEDCLWRWHTYSISPCQPRYDNISKGKQVMTWRLVVPPESTEVIHYSVLYSNVPL